MEEEIKKVELRKKEVEEELEREKRHQETLKQMNCFDDNLMLKMEQLSAHDQQRILELERLKQLKVLEMSKMEELAKINAEKQGDQDEIREAAGAVKNVAKTLMQINNENNNSNQSKTQRPVSSGSEDEMFCGGGYSEDISIGLDLPNQGTNSSSLNCFT